MKLKAFPKKKLDLFRVSFIMKRKNNFVDRFLCIIVGLPSSLIITVIGLNSHQSSDLYFKYGFLIFLGIFIVQCVTIQIVKKIREK